MSYFQQKPNQRRRSRSRSRNRQNANRFPLHPRYCELESTVKVEEVREVMEDLKSQEEPQGQLVPIGPQALVPVAPREIVPVAPKKKALVPLERKALAPLKPAKSRSLSDMQQFHPSVRELSFCVQLAHGSPTIKVTDFSSIVGLFNQIAKGFNIQRDDIVFCTVNSHKVDMNSLFTGSLDVGDMLFVHLRGQPVEVEMTKTDIALGVTIADNGLCRSFIKRIKDGSVAEAAKPALGVGQLIEQIESNSVLGLRHYEVAKVLRSIPVGKKFTMRLVNPLTNGFSFLQPRGAPVAAKKAAGNGMGTVRFKADGGVVVQTEAPNRLVIDKLNELFDSYLGVQDDELAQTIWDAAANCKTLQDMMDTVRNSELNIFDFPDELVFDMWGIVSDLKRKRETPKQPKNPFAAAIEAPN